MSAVRVEFKEKVNDIMMQIDYTQWEKILTEHKAAMDRELAEVRKYKQELVQLKSELMELGFAGRYERDTNTLILSAPTVVIGNVDKNGNLMEGNGKIILRSNDICLEGVGQTNGAAVTGGSVTTRARYINNVTVDPGIDGMENVAFSDSRFTVQSASVGMMAETIDPDPSGGVFTMHAPTSEGSISMHAEGSFNATAAVDYAGDDKRLDKAVERVEEVEKRLEKSVDAAIESVAKNTGILDKNMNNGLLDLLGAASEEADTLALRFGMYKFDERGDKTELQTSLIAKELAAGASSLSGMAEAKRVAKYLKARSERLNGENDKYKDELTGNAINLVSECINLKTEGADGAIRTAPGNGVSIVSQNVKFEATDGLKPIEESKFSILANDICMDASEYTYEEKDEKMELTKTEAKGIIRMNAHNIDLSGIDRVKDGDELKPKITQNSLIWMCADKAHVDLADHEGKSQGVLYVNAKETHISAYDVDPKDRIKPSAITQDGLITLGAQKVIVGDVVKDMKSDMIQLSAKNVNVMGEEKVSLQQAQDKSHLLLDDNAELSGGDVKLVGKINLGGETTIEAKFTAGDIEAKNVKASGSVSGPNLKDGIAIPGAAAPAQPTKGAELTEIESLDKRFAQPDDKTN